MANQTPTLDSIVEELKERVLKGEPIAPSQYLDAAVNLNLLSLDLDDELVTAEMQVNQLRNKEIESGKTAAAAKIRVEATEEYKNLLTLTAKRERITELVRLAKKRVDLSRWDQ
jgi:hypothetical protein